jgi:predicted permease
MKSPSSDSSRESGLVRAASGTAGDLKVAVHRLRKEGLFTATALLTLALCIGANTAIFSMVYDLVLRQLPFPQPDRIVQIDNDFPKPGLNGLPSNLVQYADFKAHSTAFDTIGLMRTNQVMVGEPGSAERVTLAAATAEMFDVLGLRPLIGQFFTLDNSHPGEDLVVVLTEPYWRSHFNGDPGVLGKTLRVDDKACRILGVAPRSFGAFNAEAKFIRPIAYKPEDVTNGPRYGCNTWLYARLRPGLTTKRALDDVGALEKHFYDAAPAGYRGFLDRSGHRMSVTRFQAERIGYLKPSLYLLQGGALFVLLIGCVNVANLMLARANGQQSELAIRAALGAGRGAIARQLIVESLVLTLGGAVAGIGLAYGGVAAINHFTSRLLAYMEPVAIEHGVMIYTAIISVAVGLLIGLIPVVHILRSNLAAVINRSTRGSSGARGVRALSSILVTGQIAIALVLLSGAGLLIHSFAKAVSVQPGFDPSKLVVGRIALPALYQDQAKATAFQRALDRGLREIAGVDDAALATGVPFQGRLGILALSLKEGTLAPNASQPGAFLVGVSFDYFRTLHIQLLEGRYFDETDAAKGHHDNWIVDEKFEQKFFPGRSAVGCHFTFGGTPEKDSDWPTIVGVVRYVPHNGVEDKSGNPYVYYPVINRTEGGLNIFVRSNRPTADLFAAVREKLRAIDPTLPLFETQTVEQTMDESHNNRRAVMLLLVGFAGLALFLSAIGIYGVLAYDVSQRTREIGIRGAIGASREQIVGLIMRQGLWKTAIGLGVGLVGALVLGQFMVSLLFELKATDPWAYLLVSLLLAVVAVAASYLPARRAARIDPIEALRID